MKQKEQQLLLKELCARLPYGIKVVYLATTYSIQYVDSKFDEVKLEGMSHTVSIGHIKLYLRPLSSMTKEERKEYRPIMAFSGSPDGAANFTDWLNKKMFAYRTIDGKDMFELGLAIEVTEENNPYKY